MFSLIVSAELFPVEMPEFGLLAATGHSAASIIGNHEALSNDLPCPPRGGQLMATASVPGISIPTCQPGIGDVILSPDSPKLIRGIGIRPYPIWPDDRGYFMEIMRGGQGFVQEFDPATSQVSAALSYAGSIKAFHFHLEQTDCWVPAQGMLQVALVDLRPDSPTFGAKNTMYVGMLRPWQILIPPGIGHGYKVIGSDHAMLVYVTNRFYNPKDEGRIAHNHPEIAYDWELQHK